MSVRKPQYEKFDGKVAEIFPEGDYLQVRTVMVEMTSNIDCHDVWHCICSEAQRISAQPHALQPEVSKDSVEDILQAINNVFAWVSKSIVTRANRLFGSAHGGGPGYAYENYPIRWPESNRVMLHAILQFVASAFQVPQIRSNCLDRGLVDEHAWTVLRPLFDLKARIMRTWFGLEVKGEVSVDELQAIFRGQKLNPPLNKSLDDQRDTVADKAAEDQMAMGDESAYRPPIEIVEQAMTGAEVWTWAPTSSDWITFAEMIRRSAQSGPTQFPGEPFVFDSKIIKSS